MKDSNQLIESQTENNVKTVLQAEKEAEQSVRDCESEVQISIGDAHTVVQNLNTRTDQRISDMEMRHAHKLNHLIKSIEKQYADTLSSNAESHHNIEEFRSVIEALAAELCLGKPDDTMDSAVEPGSPAAAGDRQGKTR
jgi:hypothetical protein